MRGYDAETPKWMRGYDAETPKWMRGYYYYYY